jgi:uncharacterized protein YbaP (TraB family)
MVKQIFAILLIALSSLGSCRHVVPSTANSTSSAAIARQTESVQSLPSEKASLWARPILYRFTKNESIFYVFGTIHLPDERFQKFPKELEESYAKSDALYTEIPIDENAQSVILPRLLLPAGQKLSDFVPKQLLERLSSVFEAQKIPFGPVQRIKPWAIALQLVMLDQAESVSKGQPLDAMLYERAKKDEKSIGGLETVVEQLELFDGLTNAEQVEMLKQTLDHREEAKAQGRNILTELLEAYVNGDESRLEAIMREEYDPTDAFSVKLMQRVLFSRNESLTARIVSHVEREPKKTFFFAVGSGHLVGKEGVIERLRQRGIPGVRLVP